MIQNHFIKKQILDIEEICKNLFEVCFQFIKETLNQAKLNKEDIDYIILSGRSFIRIDKQINNFNQGYFDNRQNFTL